MNAVTLVPVLWARRTAQRLLEPLGDRWRHVRAVGECAEQIAGIVDEQSRDLLVAAAYLHDIGYAPELHRTGLHQLDGARYLRALGLERLACLVAHHSAARFEVELRGHADALVEFPAENSVVADALIYCDITTGPTGEPLSPAERLDEVATRYEPGGQVLLALDQARPHLLAAIERVEALLEAEEQPATP